MGSVSRKRERDTKTLELFEARPEDQCLEPPAENYFRLWDSPVWTENKAKMIRNYVRYFIMVTHHGTYIDAFAGPQVERFNDDSWAAKLVLEIQPAWLRRFVLCELGSEQATHLEQLVGERRAAGDARAIELLKGNCNDTLPAALAKNPIKPKEATFCLLDQRQYECDWATVKSLAKHKTEGNKIELFYFLPVGWVFRTLKTIKDEQLLRWWGRGDLDLLRRANTARDLAHLFTERFAKELGYSCVRGWPIRERDAEGRIMFVMIHAADHEEAPKLMFRAYRKATGAQEPMEHKQAEFDVDGFDRAAMSR